MAILKKSLYFLISLPLIPNRVRTYLLKFTGINIDRTARVAEFVYIGGSKLCIRSNVVINVGSFLDTSAMITINDGVRIGPHVKILTGTHRYRNSVMRRNPNDGTDAYPVTIERGCWIGINSTILPSVTIAEGCIIAAGSVVTKSTEPNGMYAGIPAKRLKNLSVEDDLDGQPNT